MAPLPRLIVFSGAGLSAESGLRTFRGPSGLWEGVPIEKVCHIDTWEDNFDAVHEFYDARRVGCAGAEPNEAHRTIAEWQKAWPERTILLTQNIDRLLERAGCTDVIHLHGDALLMQCIACTHEWEIGNTAYNRKGCPACGTIRSVKPGVVFFGEQAPRYNDLHEIAAALGEQDTAVVIGTSGTVLPADRLFARRAYSILVNLEPAIQMNEQVFSERHYGPATQQLAQLWKTLRARMAVS